MLYNKARHHHLHHHPFSAGWRVRTTRQNTSGVQWDGATGGGGVVQADRQQNPGRRTHTHTFCTWQKNVVCEQWVLAIAYIALVLCIGTCCTSADNV